MIERTVARRPGQCYLCQDVVNVGDEVVAGDQDDPYLHPACLERDMADDGRRDGDQREARMQAELDATAYAEWVRERSCGEWIGEGRLV